MLRLSPIYVIVFTVLTLCLYNPIVQADTGVSVSLQIHVQAQPVKQVVITSNPVQLNLQPTGGGAESSVAYTASDESNRLGWLIVGGASPGTIFAAIDASSANSLAQAGFTLKMQVLPPPSGTPNGTATYLPAVKLSSAAQPLVQNASGNVYGNIVEVSIDGSLSSGSLSNVPVNLTFTVE